MSRVTRAFRITGRLIKFLVGLLIFAVIALIVWRVVSSNNPKEMERLIPNEKLISAYEEKGDELRMFKQDQRSITSSDKNYGYFSITDYAIIPEANQIQTIIRYNNSTLRYTAEDYDLSEVPERDAEVYDVTLLLAIDLTPDNEEDNLGNDESSVKFVRCHGKMTLSDQKNLYNFRQMVFDLDTVEVNLKELIDSNLLLAIYADFYYIDDIDYEKTPYGTLCLYDFKSENMRITLDKKDIKAIENYAE
ncbi:MAG: hypothetical protein J6U86_03635 [Clostridia bacterium]|nr:hypothetical protein [Clostridia bacterium]